MIDNSFRCDAPGCTVRKGEGNHWLIFDKRAAAKGMFIVRYWHDELAKTWGHLCSDQCAIKVMVRIVRSPQMDLCSACGHAAHASDCKDCEPGSRCRVDQCRHCFHPYHGAEPCDRCPQEGDVCYAGAGRTVFQET